MTKRILLVLFVLFIGLSVRAQTNTVTYNVNPGFNLFVNQLNAGSNSIGEVLGYNVPDQTTVYLYTPGQEYNAVRFIVSFGGWFNELDGGTMTNGPQLA